MSSESKKIHALYKKLVHAERTAFPKAGEPLVAPGGHGVYAIYGPRGTVLHVGRTIRGKNGLRQRLANHLHASSSFTNEYLRGKGSKLRGTHRYALIEVSNSRARALLEALAIGCLCPKHIGVGEIAS
jgi:hypothetical protein